MTASPLDKILNSKRIGFVAEHVEGYAVEAVTLSHSISGRLRFFDRSDGVHLCSIGSHRRVGNGWRDVGLSHGDKYNRFCGALSKFLVDEAHSGNEQRD